MTIMYNCDTAKPARRQYQRLVKQPMHTVVTNRGDGYILTPEQTDQQFRIRSALETGRTLLL